VEQGGEKEDIIGGEGKTIKLEPSPRNVLKANRMRQTSVRGVVIVSKGLGLGRSRGVPGRVSSLTQHNGVGPETEDKDEKGPQSISKTMALIRKWCDSAARIRCQADIQNVPGRLVC